MTQGDPRIRSVEELPSWRVGLGQIFVQVVGKLGLLADLQEVVSFQVRAEPSVESHAVSGEAIEPVESLVVVCRRELEMVNLGVHLIDEAHAHLGAKRNL